MRPEDAAPKADKTIRLSDYRAPDWMVEKTDLHFALSPTATRVTATIQFRRTGSGPADLYLDGHSMTLISARINGAEVSADAMRHGDESLTIAASALPDDGFEWTCVTEINPSANTALEGLYMSNGMYCTQCEAEGFRKITYYPDRPDVMAPFTVRVEGDAPVLLSNGNLAASGDGFADWVDPWPKPAYLFALVAGDLVSHDDSFTTMSGRAVELRIWVRPGDEHRCAYAMDALKRSMRWDETEYGREYDLDIFQIVAVEDFNMGAMENKGLNVFNSKYVLATPDTATDRDFELIEAIIAHEYFHNWTGNRITCRDWFQLCLKEGLTVFRDQQFSSDMRSAPVHRIGEVQQLRARQFREDGGPLAHPVRPEAYIEINNFYTATVYEKGAEVIGMLRRLVGADAYAKALDLYFERHDGQACTIEDWLTVFEDATGRELGQFARWYSQAGTPRVNVAEAYDDGTYHLTLTQTTPSTPGQAEKAPQVIPCAFGLLSASGDELTSGMLELTEETETWSFDLAERPIASLFRNFSAPVIVEREISAGERAFLMAHDTDPFNRWEAGRGLAMSIARNLLDEPEATVDTAWIDAMTALLADRTLEPAFRAMVLGIPGHDELAADCAARGRAVDPDAIHATLTKMGTSLASALSSQLADLHSEMAVSGPYLPEAEPAGRRSLRNAALAFLTKIDGGKAALAQFAAANGPDGNMTESLAALRALVHEDTDGAGDALAAFHTRWRDDSLVLDKWYLVQATSSADGALKKVEALAGDPDFPWKNPNKFRSLIGAFAAGNPVGFHAADGSGYRFFTDWLIRMDDANPQTAARVAGAFETWQRYGADRQALMRTQMQRLMAKDNLSKDMGEIVGRILGT